jgi:hypothetical protein
MEPLTADMLVEIIAQLSLHREGGLVAATDVVAYCRSHGIEAGGPSNFIFWSVDLHEAGAGSRLLKFRTSNSRHARNHYALRHDASPAPAGGPHPARAVARQRGWVECAWAETRWDYANAQVPPP